MKTKRKMSALARRYELELRRYLKRLPAASVQPALKLGCQAVALGLETLDLALIHEHAVLGLAMAVDAPAERAGIVKRSKTFFALAIQPLEETHRSAVESNARLSQLNKALSQRTLDLAVSNRLLKQEIARREVVEGDLRQSERHSIQLLKESRQLQDQLRLLSRRILSVQEEERKQISRELHDVIAQTLTGINVRLATLKRESTADTKGLSRKIARTQRLVEKSVDIVHRFAQELRPAMLDDLGLIPALHSFLKRFMKETGVRVSLTAFAGVEEVSSATRTVLYRVAQEALTNVDRHARASRVDVSIQEVPNAIRMQIKDDGQSLHVQPKGHARKRQHLGLLGMRERLEMVSGTFAIESALGQGTTITAHVPFNNRAKEHASP